MLDRLDWLLMEEEQRIDTVNTLNQDFSVTIGHRFDGQLLNPETTLIRFGALPFYEEGYLLEIYDRSKDDMLNPLWFLYWRDDLFHLDGSSAPIHDMNEAAQIMLSKETVVDYVYFFCFFVHGDEGPFLVVEDSDFPAFDKEKNDSETLQSINESCLPLELTKVDENGTFLVSGTVLYGNALFSSSFALTENGMIEMIDDHPIFADIYVRKIKPNY